MSAYGDGTAKQEIYDELRYSVAKTKVHPLVFLQLVLEVVADIAAEFACEADVGLKGKSVKIYDEDYYG